MGDVIPLPGVHITEDEHLGRPCRARWIDSGMSRDKGWAKREAYMALESGAMECETVGLWLGEDDEHIVIAQTRDKQNDNWLMAQVIWKHAVLLVEWLHEY